MKDNAQSQKILTKKVVSTAFKEIQKLLKAHQKMQREALQFSTAVVYGGPALS